MPQGIYDRERGFDFHLILWCETALLNDWPLRAREWRAAQAVLGESVTVESCGRWLGEHGR